MNGMDRAIEQIEAVPLRNGRRIVAIAGAPASGKSTLAKELAARLPDACVVPMDGFHRDNSDLERHDLLSVKGAPQTFDVDGFCDIIKAIGTSQSLDFPTFDRLNDRTVPGGGHINASHSTILVEGNYLLLDADPWTDLFDLWDFRIFLDVPLHVLEDRLVARWLKYGHLPDEAKTRAEGNDLPNARLVAAHTLPADLRLKHSDLAECSTSP